MLVGGGLEKGAWATGILLVTAWQLCRLSQAHSSNPGWFDSVPCLMVLVWLNTSRDSMGKHERKTSAPQ